MTKSASQIRLDYNNAIRQADNLKEIARELRSTADREFQDCVSEISRNWSGSNSTAYVHKCNILKSNMINSAQKLDRTADTIRRIARNIYNAEMSALALARTRKY